jgi:TonB family protein
LNGAPASGYGLPISRQPLVSFRRSRKDEEDFVRLRLGRFTSSMMLAVLALARQAGAQADDTHAVTLPRIVRFVEADRPEQHPDRDVAVRLELTIDAEGRVSEARVVEGAGEAFDRAALAAARQFEFSPARRGAEPIGAKIEYRYVFRRQSPPPKPEPVEPPPAPLATRKRDAATRDLSRDRPHAPVAAASPAAEPEFGATARVEAATNDPVRRSFEAEDLARVPGVRGDAIRAIDIMPGISRGDSFDGGTPLIRGANQLESQVFLDGTPVPLLFHFGGLTSFFQSRLLDRVELYPGNYSSRYGRVTGGVVEARVRQPRRDRVRAMLDLSVLDSAALLEAPLGPDGGIALAARRSNVDFFFSALVPEDAYSVVAAPVYYDYQALATYDVTADSELRLMLYGSRDAIDLVFSDPDESDPLLRGSVGGAVSFHRVNLRFAGESDALEHSTSVTFGVADMDFRLGPLAQRLEAYELSARSDLGIRLSSAVELGLGLDFWGQLADGRYVGPRPTAWDSTDPAAEESPALSETVRLARDDMTVAQPAAWLELALRPAPHVVITPGVRLDYFENLDAWAADPRLSSRVDLGRLTTFKAGVGWFTQPPQWYEVLDSRIGNPKLDPYRALQLGAGVEQKLGPAVQVGVEGFYKRIYNRVVGTRGGRPPHLVNDGSGRIYGAELALRLKPNARTFGYLAYTLARSERSDHGGPWLLWNNDQTHVLSAVASQRLGRGWEVGARFRYVTGNPETPIVAAAYDARIDQYRPIYGAVNSEREAAFHQLDVRVEKRWQISDLTLAAYLEVLNVSNAENQEGARYSYDYSKRETLSGLPILPNVGIRGEL